MDARESGTEGEEGGEELPQVGGEAEADRTGGQGDRAGDQDPARPVPVDDPPDQDADDARPKMKERRPDRHRRDGPAVLIGEIAEEDTLVEDADAPGDEGDAIAGDHDVPAVVDPTHGSLLQ